MKNPRLREQHISTYDALADEYERRVAELLPVLEIAADTIDAHLPREARVLDIGCGVGGAIEMLNSRGHDAYGLELSMGMAKYAYERNKRFGTQIVVGDFEDYAFNNDFDGLMALAFIHLFPKERAEELMAGMHQTLKPGGVLLIGTTESNEPKEGLEEKHDYLGKHVRFRKHWTDPELRASLESVGFEVIEKVPVVDAFGKNWMDFIVRKPNEPVE